jgi:DoxX-like family
MGARSAREESMATTNFRYLGRERLLHVSVGIGQVALAFYFTISGLVKLLLEPAARVEIMPWTHGLPALFVHTLGAVELALAVGVALPAVTYGPQRVVGSAALSCATLLTAGVIVHVLHGELRMAVVSAAMAALAAFVAWGRLMHAPVEEAGRG